MTKSSLSDLSSVITFLLEKGRSEILGIYDTEMDMNRDSSCPSKPMNL